MIGASQFRGYYRQLIFDIRFIKTMLEKKLTTTNTKVEIALKMVSLECDFHGPRSKFGFYRSFYLKFFGI